MRLPQYASALTASLPFAARTTPPQLNIFGDIFDDGLKAIEPYERPLLPSLVKSSASSYTLQEKMFSLSGEDFKVKDLSGSDVLYIDGGNINLGGWVLDKLAFKDAATGQKFCSVERRAIAMSTCYDIYSADGSELLCKVERDFLSMTPSACIPPRSASFALPSMCPVKFLCSRPGYCLSVSLLRAPCLARWCPAEYKFYYEGDANPFADFEAEGSFTDRTYTFKAGGPLGGTIAKVRRAPELVKDLDTYVVDVAAGVDAAAILAVAVIIDEDHDEEDARKEKEQREEEGGGGMWPFG